MYWDDYSDYYEQEPSEVDEIINDAVRKITDVITERAKDEIDSIMNKAKHLEEQNTIERQQRADAWKETAAWKKKCEELTKELEKQRTELKLEFEVGEKVFFTRYRHDRTKKVFCSECGGKGVIKRIVDGEEYSKKCHKCKGNTYYYSHMPEPQKEVEYYEYYPEYDVIESVNANISKSGIKYTYCLKQYGTEHEVFRTRDEALARAEEKSKQSFDKAKMKLEGKKVKE
jgi:hypothetical protein